MTQSFDQINEADHYGHIKNTSLAAPGALAHHLQRCTAFKIQNANQTPPKWSMGSGKVPTCRFLGTPAKKVFYPSTPSKRKGRNGRETGKTG